MTSEDRLPAGSPTKRPASAPAGTLERLLAILAGAALLALGLMFSLVALAAVLVVGSLVYAYLHWKTRHLRRHLEQQMRDQENWRGSEGSGSGRVIEGELIDDAREAADSPTAGAILPAAERAAAAGGRSRPVAGDG